MKHLKYFLLLCTLLITTTVASTRNPKESIDENNLSRFSARISRVNVEASLVRLKVDFKNMKFLNKGDKLEIFFSDSNQPTESKNTFHCKATLVGKTNEYLLIKMIDLKTCIDKTHFSVGIYTLVECNRLKQKLIIAQEVIDILLKKKLALTSRLTREEKDISQYINKIESINKKYDLLRTKLESEWQEELSAIENDRLISIKNSNDLKNQLIEVEHKIEEYSMDDQNFSSDRWSLDSINYKK
ncbi:MAG: hypothetical protein HQK49_02475 [Oligoflexia bacterium]|nr:hypothetical protein [Oligoflexia bacterium]